MLSTGPAAEPEIRHPLLSTVVHLASCEGDDRDGDSGDTGAGAGADAGAPRLGPEWRCGGPTVVLDQTIGSAARATRGWVAEPVDGSVTFFDGGLLHGVLPAHTPVDSAKQASARAGFRRLTLMIGWWGHDVHDAPKPAAAAADSGKEEGDDDDDDEEEEEEDDAVYYDALYGPCRPVPPLAGVMAARPTTWPSHFAVGAEPSDEDQRGGGDGGDDAVELHPLAVSPVWASLEEAAGRVDPKGVADKAWSSDDDDDEEQEEEQEDGEEKGGGGEDGEGEDDEDGAVEVPWGIDQQFFLRSVHYYKDKLLAEHRKHGKEEDCEDVSELDGLD